MLFAAFFKSWKPNKIGLIKTSQLQLVVRVDFVWKFEEIAMKENLMIEVNKIDRCVDSFVKIDYERLSLAFVHIGGLQRAILSTFQAPSHLIGC